MNLGWFQRFLFGAVTPLVGIIATRMTRIFADKRGFYGLAANLFLFI